MEDILQEKIENVSVGSGLEATVGFEETSTCRVFLSESIRAV